MYKYLHTDISMRETKKTNADPDLEWIVMIWNTNDNPILIPHLW